MASAGLVAGDALQRVRVQQLSALGGLPVLATGQVCMHVRSRKPLHDVLTAVRWASRCRPAALRCRPMPSTTCAVADAAGGPVPAAVAGQHTHRGAALHLQPG